MNAVEGVSFVVTKKVETLPASLYGLRDTWLTIGTGSNADRSTIRLSRRRLFIPEKPHLVGRHSYTYVLRGSNPVFSTPSNLITDVVGEFFNFAAYAFAPAILVTPLGALAVLVGAVLASFFLHEHLGTLGRMGSAVCLLGAVIIVLHAPPDKDVQTVDEILEAAVRSGQCHRILFARLRRLILPRVSLLRSSCHRILCLHDLCHRPDAWQVEPARLRINLLYRWLYHRHVG